MEKLIEELQSIPSQVKELKLQIMGLNNIKHQTSERLNEIEMKHKDTINRETTKDGKKLYSNDDARRTALALFLKEDTEYTKLSSDNKKIDSEIHTNLIEINFLEDIQKNNRYILGYLSSTQ